jgi:hypothetical protein
MAIASVVKRKMFTENQIPVIAGIIKHYKSVGYKVVDGNETLMIIEPNSTFRIFISRVSHCVQFYFLGEPGATQEFYTRNLESADQLVQEEAKYKAMFG